jgi:triosephosphate isomerase
MGVLIINFKTYPQGTGETAVDLAKIAEKVANETGKEIILAVDAVDLEDVSKAVKIPVFAQHIDAVEFGSHTGSIVPEVVKEAGATGTLINHSEKKLDKETIKKTVERAKQIGLRICICAQTPDEAAELSDFKPEFVAYEPPELIGGEISVSNAKPEVIKEAVDKVKTKNPEVKVLAGAGVKDVNDVKIAAELGTEGVLAASHIVKAKDPEQIIKEIANAL